MVCEPCKAGRHNDCALGGIAQFAKGRAKKKIPEMIAALEGHQMSDHHRRMIRTPAAT